LVRAQERELNKKTISNDGLFLFIDSRDTFYLYFL
jgi:hypothetical protein